MESYLDRKTAKLRNESKYFTGLACKNGHITYRYTRSGACSGCIRASNAPIVDENSLARKKAKGDLVQIRCRLYDTDRESFALAAWAMAAMRYPMLEVGDIDPHTLGSDRSAGTGMYAYYCHVDDVAALRAVAADMCRQHRVDIESVRQKVFAGAAYYLPADSTPPISFK